MNKEEKGKTSEDYLSQVELPQATKTYTVISHGGIIQKIENELNIAGLTITGRDYLHCSYGEVAVGKVYIIDNRDPDINIAFTWANSYNKQVKFGCGIGGLIVDNNAVMLGSEGTSWIRMHTGTADAEAYDIIEQLVEQLNPLFDKLIAEKEKMKAQPVDQVMFGHIMGALFFEQGLLTPTQSNAVKKEWDKPTHEYTDKDTLWGLYKILMYGIEMGDIKKWHVSQQKLHHLIMAEYAIANVNLDSEVVPFIALTAQAAMGINTSNIESVDHNDPEIHIESDEEYAERVAIIEGDKEESREEMQQWADEQLAKEDDGSEHVGPPEMYIAGMDATGNESASDVVIVKKTGSIIEVMKPAQDEANKVVEQGKTAPELIKEIVQEKKEKSIFPIEQLEKQKEKAVDTSAFINVAKQLGYDEADAQQYVTYLYDSNLPDSKNLKAFRTWVAEGKILEGEADQSPVVEEAVVEEEVKPTGPKVIINVVNMEEEKERFAKKDAEVKAPVIKMDEPEVSNGTKPNIIFTEEIQGVTAEDIKRAQHPVLTKDAFKAPVDGFTSMAKNAGYSDPIIDFYAKDHFDNNLEIVANYEAFVAWAPKPSNGKPVVKAEETPTVSAKTIMIDYSAPPEEAITDFVPVATTDEVEDNLIADMEAIVANSQEDEMMDENMLSLFSEGVSHMEPVIDEPKDDNKEMKSLLGADTLDRPVEIMSPEESKAAVAKIVPEVEESVTEVTEAVTEEEETVTEVVEEKNPFLLEEEEEDILDTEDLNSGLEPSEEVVELADTIEERMTELYGEVRPYAYEEIDNYINITIDETLERFSIPA